MKCDKCNGSGQINLGIRDRFNQPIELDQMLVWINPNPTFDFNEGKVTVEFKVDLLFIDEIEQDILTGRWKMTARSYYGGYDHYFEGHLSKPAMELISLNKSMNDMQKDGGL